MSHTSQEQAANVNTAAPSAAQDLWQRDPVAAFEQLRDLLCSAGQLVLEIHHEAAASPQEEELDRVAQRLHEQLADTVMQAAEFLETIPVARYLDQRSPVYLDCQEGRTIARISESCYHRLLLRVAFELLQRIRAGQPAGDFVFYMRFYTGAGDLAENHFAGLIPSVRCECQQAIDRWRRESALSAADPVSARSGHAQNWMRGAAATGQRMTCQKMSWCGGRCLS
jgi:hypothetical protein